MLPANSWTFDLEIVNAILGKGEIPVPSIRYCLGWGDHAGMGVSVLVAEHVASGEVRVFIGDMSPSQDGSIFSQEPYHHLGDFQKLIHEADLLIGHNSRGFDAKVLAAKGFVIPPTKHLDFYHEVKGALRNQFPKGYNLNDLSVRCGGPAKSGDGGLAPHDWQKGKRQQVVDYCKNDIRMTTAIAKFYARNSGSVVAFNGELLRLRSPQAIALGA